MTDNEIIKALECCTSSTTSEACNGCPLYSTTVCTEMENGVMIYALDLINRQKAKIESLKELLNGWKTEAYKLADEKDQVYCNAVERMKPAKAEAIKEFAERLKEEFHVDTK